MAVFFDFRYFIIQFFKSIADFNRYLPGYFYIGVHMQKERHHQVFSMGQVD